MRDLKNEILAITEEWSSIAAGRLPEDQISAVSQHVRSKLGQMNPVISLYGVYNAGKSTLLNALTGESMAPMGSAPTTYSVNQYNWGGWVIYDTPGIDAPVEHQTVTEEHLKKSECVLFVISTNGTTEESLVYEKIAEVTKRNKAVLIVLNDKNSILKEGGAIDALGDVIRSVDSNLLKVWKRCGLDEDRLPQKVVVNAASALKGKLENKALLVKNSNIGLLEDHIECFMRNRGEKDVVNAVADYLDEFIARTHEVLLSELQNPVLSECEKAKRDLEYERKRVLIGACRLLKNALNQFASSVLSFDEQDKNRIEAALTEGTASIAQEVEQYLNTELGAVAKRYESETRKCIVRSVESCMSDDFPSCPDSDLVGEAVVCAVKSIPKKSIDKFTEETIKAVLIQLKRFKVPFIKDVSEKILGKWAKKFAGPVVMLAFAGFEIFSAHRKQDEYQRQVQAQQQARELLINRIRNEMYGEFEASVTEIVDTFFGKLFEDIDMIEKKARGELSDAQEQLRVVQDIARRVGALVAV